VLFLPTAETGTQQLPHRIGHLREANRFRGKPLARRQLEARMHRPQRGEIDDAKLRPFAAHGRNHFEPLQIFVVATVEAGDHHPRSTMSTSIIV
jgi:hypothetical protein